MKADGKKRALASLEAAAKELDAIIAGLAPVPGDEIIGGAISTLNACAGLIADAKLRVQES